MIRSEPASRRSTLSRFGLEWLRPLIGPLLRRLRAAPAASGVDRIRTAHPPGHFYSPVVDPDEILDAAPRIWPASPDVLGIDFNDRSHESLLSGPFAAALRHYDYPHTPPEPPGAAAYYSDNSQFGWLDSRVLFALLLIWRPRRIIEVGSGYSTVLMNEVNRRFLAGECAITCVEPFPREFLLTLPGVRLIRSKVQDIALAEFEQLEAGDVLFIDSSHVAKTGSDVNWLVFEVLPRLRSGVRVHFHDVFLPHDYPADWVIAENRSWNEQYVLRALLMYSNTFSVLFGSSYAWWRFPQLMRTSLDHQDDHAFVGGSFWIERR